LLGLIVVLAAVPAMAEKIGFLDVERAVLTVKEGTSQLQVLEGWAKPRRDHIEQLKSQVAELNQRLATQQSIASAETLAQLEGDLVQAQRQLEDEVRAFNRELPARRDKMLGELSTKL
jgi:Skp family chaperone for outer membrane proteins